MSGWLASGEGVFAVDLGGSKLMTSAVTAEGHLYAVRRVEPVPKTPTEILEVIADHRDRLVENGHVLRGAGVAIPGLTDSGAGLWRHASFSGIRDWVVREAVERRLGIPVAIANDVDACALAEARWGGARGKRDFLWITLSNGVGGALFLNGELYAGAGCAAGEIGHMKAVRGGHSCGCGGRGCLEQYASGRAIARAYAERTGGSPLGAREIAELAKRGQAHALEAFREAGRHLGAVLADAISLLNVPLVFLGGGVAQSFALMRETFDATMVENLYPEANPLPEVQVTQLGYEAALLGAASVFLQSDNIP